MMINLTSVQLSAMLKDAMEIGCKKTLVELGMLKPYVSKSEAYKMYGRKQVDRWLKEKLLNYEKDGTNSSKIRISRMELETISKTSNRTSWYKHYVTSEV